MRLFIRQLRPALLVAVVASVIFGLVYPLVVTGIGQVAFNDKADGSLLQDTIESAYFRFRRRLRDVKQASTCECKACVAMGDLAVC